MSIYDPFELEVYGTPCLIAITHYSEGEPATFDDTGTPEELHWLVLTLDGHNTGISEDTMTGRVWQSVYDACKKHIEQAEWESRA